MNLFKHHVAFIIYDYVHIKNLSYCIILLNLFVPSVPQIIHFIMQYYI